MNSKKILTLASIVVLLAVLSIIVNLQQNKKAISDIVVSGALLPDMTTQAEKIDRIELTEKVAGELLKTTLVKTGDFWRVDEQYGYLANKAKLTSLVNSLTLAQYLEPKTSQEKYYDRLKVMPAEATSKSDSGVKFSAYAGEKQLFQIMLGKNAEGIEGTYTRFQNEERTWLVDQKIATQADPLQWLTKVISVIPANTVKSIAYLRGGEGPVIERTGAGDSFVISPLPNDMVLKYDEIVDSTQQYLNRTQLESVLPKSSTNLPPSEFDTSYKTFNGVEVLVQGYQIDDQQLLTLTAGTYLLPSDGKYSAAAEEVAQYNALWSEWVYVVSKSTYENFAMSWDYFAEVSSK